MSTWKQAAKATIAKVIKENPDADYKTFKKKLKEAYPFGEREHFPYKVWLECQRHTLNLLYPNRMGRMRIQPEEGLFNPLNF